MHTFLVEQPELNWRNPAVEAAQFAMVRGWLDRGVDGFRLDVFNVFLKHPDLLANPEVDGATPWARQQHLYDRDQPDFPDLIARFRAILDEQPGRMSVGELFSSEAERAVALTTDRHMVFDWALLAAPWSATAFGSAIRSRESMFGADRWPANVLSNHDQSRQASRLAASAGIGDTDAVARAAAVVLLTIRGTPFLYYGEEIGLRDVAGPGGGDHRSARATGARRPRVPVVEPRPMSLADAVERRAGPRVHDAAGRGSVRRRRRRPAMSRPRTATPGPSSRPTDASSRCAVRAKPSQRDLAPARHRHGRCARVVSRVARRARPRRRELRRRITVDDDAGIARREVGSDRRVPCRSALTVARWGPGPSPP